MKQGQIWSKIRSQGQIVEKPFAHFTGYSLNAILMKLARMLVSTESLPGRKLDHVRSKTRS